MKWCKWRVGGCMWRWSRGVESCSLGALLVFLLLFFVITFVMVEGMRLEERLRLKGVN